MENRFVVSPLVTLPVLHLVIWPVPGSKMFQASCKTTTPADSHRT